MSNPRLPFLYPPFSLLSDGFLPEFLLSAPVSFFFPFSFFLLTFAFLFFRVISRFPWSDFFCLPVPKLKK
ncbi:MAG: hypothetical protein D6679_03870 [Candidatus Hydrogenedentota bacterium]|nr:MAG: hypothetical protein D6679_03870 [Candidatus Hydrogenedentota bacterium]